MSKLKKDVYNITKEKYADLSKEEFELTNQVIFRHLLNLPYYKNNYEYSYVIQNHDNEAILYNYDKRTREYSLFDSIIDEPYYNEEGISLFNLSNIKNIYMSKDHKDFISNIIHDFVTSSNFYEYLPKIEKAIKEDPNFYSKLTAIKENLFNLESSAMIEKTIKFCQLKKENDPIVNDLIYEITSFFNRKNNDIRDHFKKMDLLIKDEREFLNLNKDKFEFVINKIKEDKTYLFEEANLNNVSFYFFELDAYHDELSPRVTFNKEKERILEKINIIDMSKKIIENNEKEKTKTSYFDEGNFLFKNIYKQNNEISSHLNYNQIGFDFINRSTFSSEITKRSFLLAVKNNEVIGSIIYENFNNEVIESIMHENINNKKDDPLKRFYSSNVKTNYRGLGLSKLLYNKLSHIMIEEKNILINTMYTYEGEERLKRHKLELNKNNGVFFIDTDISELKNDQHDNVYCFNHEFLKYLSSKISGNIIRDNINIIKEIHSKHIQTILSTKSIDDKKLEEDQQKIFHKLETLKTKNESKNKISSFKI